MRRAALLLFVTVLLAGCGGSSSSGGGKSAGGGDRLTRAEFAAKADAICGRYQQKSKSVGQAKDLADLARIFDRMLPLLDNAMSELRALKPPKSQQHTVDRWLAQSAVARHDLQQMRDKAKAKDMKGVQAAFERAAADNKESSRLAKKLGLKACSED